MIETYITLGPDYMVQAVPGWCTQVVQPSPIICTLVGLVVYIVSSDTTAVSK